MNRFRHSLPLFLCITAITILIAALSFYPIEAEDIFSNIAYGRYIWEHKAVPSSEIFLFTGPFTTWFYDRIASSVVFYVVHAMAGFGGVLTLTWALLSTAYTIPLVWVIRRKGNIPIFLLFLALFIMASSYWFMPRSYLYSLAFVSLFYAILAGAPPNSSAFRRYLALIPLQVLWTNLQPSSLFGMVMVGAHWLTGKKSWKETAALAGLVIGNVLSPLGISYFSLLWGDFFAPNPSRKNIYEWFSPFHPAIIHQPLTLWFFLSILVFASVATLIVLNVLRSPRSRFLLLSTAIFFLYSLTSARGIMFYYIGLLFLVGDALILGAPVFKKISRVALPIVLLCVIAASTYIFRFGYSNGVNTRRFSLSFARDKFPEVPLTQLASYNLDGNIFTEYGSGSFLVWKLYGAKRAFMDGALHDRIYDNGLYDHYIKIGNDRDTIKSDVTKYTIQAFVLPLPTSADDIVEIYKYLSTDPGWVLTYFDDHFLVFMDAGVAQEKQVPTFSLLNPLLDLEKALKEKPTVSDAVEAELKQAEQILPDSFNRRALFVTWLWGSNQTPAARAKLEELTHYCDDRDPSAPCYIRLVRQLFKYNQLTKALQYTNRITSWFAPSSYTYILKGDVEAAAGKFDLAKKSYKQGLNASLNNVEQATIAAKLKTLEETKKRYEATNGN